MAEPATDEELAFLRECSDGERSNRTIYVQAEIRRLLARIDAEQARADRAEAACRKILEDATPWMPDTPGLVAVREVLSRSRDG